MTNKIEIKLPDIGDFDEVEVIEILVQKGDEISKEQSIVTLESDKASMEIPSPVAGIVDSIVVKLGDKVKYDDLIITLLTKETLLTENKADDNSNDVANSQNSKNSKIEFIPVPDIGDFDEVEVIEILVQKGNKISKEQSIVTLESDKASMEIPSPVAGIVDSIVVKLGDKVKLGSDILSLIITHADIDNKTKQVPTEIKQEETKNTQNTKQNLNTKQTVVEVTPSKDFHASPSMRKLARELGVDLAIVSGSGNNGRILETDVKAFVKQALTTGIGGSAIPNIPSVDFSKFGEIEQIPLTRINKLSAKHLSACWLNIPHVTQFDEANIDDLEQFRQKQKAQGNKFTPLIFIIKAVAKALQMHPRFNASLSSDGESLIIKKYINLGIAVDTPNGLIVPVLKAVNTKSITELSKELTNISQKARDGKLSMNDLAGSCFTISSLGGIGGMQFTPIVNAPDVAILGVSRSKIKPIWNGSEFVPQLMLPLALSYDHRVIDGAQGARFITDLVNLLADLRNLL